MRKCAVVPTRTETLRLPASASPGDVRFTSVERSYVDSMRAEDMSHRAVSLRKPCHHDSQLVTQAD
ncbi:hypothetical protein EYF80_022236 [Liparis tanakae]|uniref:Uncharacterized protein n=1 Tax=Liparis tanakae TaxID=230148 RepID=A0A4Z2HRC9_9TELE|nr:hypothetical protein EYF80_022236 [Liparis tanakae]